jgi:hypothetical protein
VPGGWSLTEDEQPLVHDEARRSRRSASMTSPKWDDPGAYVDAARALGEKPVIDL